MEVQKTEQEKFIKECTEEAKRELIADIIEQSNMKRECFLCGYKLSELHSFTVDNTDEEILYICRICEQKILFTDNLIKQLIEKKSTKVTHPA